MPSVHACVDAMKAVGFKLDGPGLKLNGHGTFDGTSETRFLHGFSEL